MTKKKTVKTEKVVGKIERAPLVLRLNEQDRKLIERLSASCGYPMQTVGEILLGAGIDRLRGNFAKRFSSRHEGPRAETAH